MTTTTFPTIEELFNKAQVWISTGMEDYGKHTKQKFAIDDISTTFIKTYARDSIRAKSALRELFRKSPVWNEELQALVINGTRTHDPDPDRIRDLAFSILTNGGVWVSSKIDNALRLFWRQDIMEDDYWFPIAKEAMESIAPGAYRPGKKLSRVFKAMCVALGIADETAGSEFQRLYAQFADELTARKIDFKLFASINPVHFLTMSNPKEDDRGTMLTSCHSFNNTEYNYNNGCTGYGRDETTFIVFTVDDPNNPESFNNRKTTRQIFAYRPGSGLLLQSRMYNTSGGVYGAAEDSTLYRDLIQREISALEDVPNLWKTHASYGEYSHYVVIGEGFGGYADWIHDDFDGHISLRCDCDPDDVEPLEVGTYGLCASCGCETSYAVFCEDCYVEPYVCADCGCTCGEVFEVWGPRGWTIEVCEDCRNENYTYCSRCGGYHYNENITYVEDFDEYYCEDCLSRVAVYCDDCGKWYAPDNTGPAHDRWGNEITICEDCAERYTECDECGELYPTLAMQTVGERTLCPGCYANEIKKEGEAV